jgi:hypothetical protein
MRYVFLQLLEHVRQRFDPEDIESVPPVDLSLLTCISADVDQASKTAQIMVNVQGRDYAD